MASQWIQQKRLKTTRSHHVHCFVQMSKSLFDEDEDNELRTVVNACFNLVRNEYKDTLRETDTVMQTLITLLMVSCSNHMFNPHFF